MFAFIKQPSYFYLKQNNIMTKEERKELLIKQIIWKTSDNGGKGGQSVSISSRSMILIHEDLDITISIGCSRSQSRNKEICLILFDLALENILKE